MAEKIQGADGIVYEVDESDNLGLPLDAKTADSVQPKAGGEESSDTDEETVVDGDEGESEEETVVDDDEEPLSDEEAEELEEELDSYLDEQISARVKPELAGRDRQISKLAEELKKRDETMKTLQKDIREAKLVGMAPEERTRMEAIYDLEDRKANVDEFYNKTNDMYLSVLRLAYVQDYGQFGLTEADLEGLEEEQMDELVKDKELEYWRAQARGAPAGKATSSGKQTIAKPQAQVKTVAKKAPAGASAPSDLGGGGLSEATRSGAVAEGQGAEAMAKTLKASPWVTVRTQ